MSLVTATCTYAEDATAPDLRPVLVVDDDAAIREIVQAVLDAERYPVFTAADGAEALQHLRSGLRPGLILLDLRMPGMDGRAFREVQAADPVLSTISVVVISGDSDAPRVASGLGLECLPKPVSLDRLLSVVKRQCAAAS